MVPKSIAILKLKIGYVDSIIKICDNFISVRQLLFVISTKGRNLKRLYFQPIKKVARRFSL